MRQKQLVLGHEATSLLDEAHDEIVRREKKSPVKPEAFASVRKFKASIGAAIADGIKNARSAATEKVTPG